MSKERITVHAEGGIGVPGVLGVSFVVLKLTHVIAWSWLWVTAPFWIPFVVAVGVALGAFAWLTYEDRELKRLRAASARRRADTLAAWHRNNLVGSDK